MERGRDFVMVLGVTVKKTEMPEVFRLARSKPDRTRAARPAVAGLAPAIWNQVYYIQHTHRASVSDKLNSGGFLLLYGIR